MARKRSSRKQSRPQPQKATANTEASAPKRHLPLQLTILLVFAVVLVFGQTANFGFVSLDDPDYVTENPAVNQGLSMASIGWAFSAVHASNWHPLTWLSHMVDCELFGLDPSGHHVINVMLHAAAAVLLFLALRSLTHTVWPSVLVALLFAIHPLRAESVAWIAERKDVLSGFMAMAVLLMWSKYVRRPSPARYIATAILLSLGLLSKSMLVTLPFVLLLLDFWPCRRIPLSARQDESAPDSASLTPVQLIVEKLPLIALAGASGVVTVLAQRGAIGGLEQLQFSYRVQNAIVSWASYAWKTVLPTSLAAFYPHPVSGVPLWQVALSALFLVSVSVLVIRQIRIRPYLAAGWFWFIGTLVPVIGLLQVGSQAMADRYTYLPQIGLWIMLAWGLRDLVAKAPAWRTRVVAGVVIVILVLMIVAWNQVGSWRSSEVLYRHALTHTQHNWLAHANLAEVLVLSGRHEEGAQHARASFDLNPENHVSALLLGNAMISLDRPGEAVNAFQEAYRLRPDLLETAFNLGNAYRTVGESDSAIEYLEIALENDQASRPARKALGLELLRNGEFGRAAEVLCSASVSATIDETISFNCGLALARLSRDSEAIPRFQRAVALAPRDPVFWSTLATVLNRSGRTEEARRAAHNAVKLDPNDRRALRILEE